MTTTRIGSLLTVAWTLGTVVFTVCSCASLQSDARPRFREAAAADVVVRHYRWENLHFTKPEHREDAFLISVNRDTLDSVLEGLRIKRDLAVIILGWYYSQPELETIMQEWRTVLSRHAFKRLVCVRATGRGNDLDGALILTDTILSHAPPAQAAEL